VTTAFSVIMPTYNRGHIIGRSIRSIQAQTIRDWELIVVDDGSTDDTRAAIDEFIRADRRIRLVANNGRIGPAGARNAGIRASQAETIAFLDSDDQWDPEALANVARARQLDSSAVLIGSNYRMVDITDGSATTMTSFLFNTILPWWENYPPAAAVIPVDVIRRDVHAICQPQIFLCMAIAGYPWVQTSSAAVRRDALFAVGLFDERLQRTEDIDLWLKLSRLGPITYLDEVHATYDIGGRKHGTGIRYEFYHPSRRHSAYIEALHHLRSLERIAEAYSLNAEQGELVKHRLIAHHQRCAVAGLRECRLLGLAHLFICLTSKEQRVRLRKETKEFFHLQ
jgi:glycosyltransferase involved in cell wall biosynthesis